MSAFAARRPEFAQKSLANLSQLKVQLATSTWTGGAKHPHSELIVQLRRRPPVEPATGSEQTATPSEAEMCVMKRKVQLVERQIIGGSEQ